MRLVLDEHIASAVAAELRRRDHDVVAVTETDLRGLKDEELLSWAADAGRAIVTYDVGDFGPLSEERQAVGEQFAGLIFLSAKRYPQGRSSGALVRDLSDLLRSLPATEALSGRSIWLTSED